VCSLDHQPYEFNVVKELREIKLHKEMGDDTEEVAEEACENADNKNE
jgi:hypothetical protein